MSAGPLAGRRILVTGGSLGIGYAVCERLVAAGAEVIVAARHREPIDAAVRQLGGAPHAGLVLDVSSEADWHAAIESLDDGGPLHGVVTAAGVLGPIGPINEIELAEFRLTIEVNLIGTMLALRSCLPALIETSGAAVTFSGGGATSPLPRYDAYAVSKAAVVRLTENVAALARGVRINCIAPGFVATRMHDQTLAAGAERAGTEYYERTKSQLETGAVPAARAAELACFLLDPQAANGITGKLISAPWDPWEDEAFRVRLRESPDLGTLRRIDDQFFGRLAG